MVPAGRRSGKTELAKRKLVLSLWDCLIKPRSWDDPRFFAAAPTRDQAKKIFWNDLKKLVPKPWLDGRPRESELTIRTRWGAELSVVGLDVPERIEGTPWDGGVIDELGNCQPGIWDAHIRPALADRAGWCWQIGVPDFDGPSQVEYADRYDLARSGVDPEWAGFNWPSSDILPPEEIESARRRMDPLLFEQEFGGLFVKPGGLAFPTFDYPTHVRDDIAVYDPLLPLCWSLDFNVDPMCAGVIQHYKGQVRVIEEICINDSSTDVACTEFMDRAQKRGWRTDNLKIYGDPAGHSRGTTSKNASDTDWIIVMNRLKNLKPTMKVLNSHSPIKDTLNAVRGRLKNAAGDVNLYVNSQCKRLIQDFRSLLWPSDLSEGHCAAWLRYFCDWEYPIRSERSGGGMRAGAM